MTKKQKKKKAKLRRKKEAARKQLKKDWPKLVKRAQLTAALLPKTKEADTYKAVCKECVFGNTQVIQDANKGYIHCLANRYTWADGTRFRCSDYVPLPQKAA